MAKWSAMAISGRLACCLLSVCLALNADAQPVAEYEVKAAFLYNFALFTDWPTDWPPENRSEMLFCIYGLDPFGGALDDLAGKTIHGRPIAVRRLNQAEEAKSCHVLFIPESERSTIPILLRHLKGASTLTVGDRLSFTEEGAMIGLSLRGNRVLFEVNREATRQARLAISSKLLQLAIAVR